MSVLLSEDVFERENASHKTALDKFHSFRQRIQIAIRLKSGEAPLSNTGRLAKVFSAEVIKPENDAVYQSIYGERR